MNSIEQFKFLSGAEGAQLLEWAGSSGLGEFNLAAKLREKTTPENAAAITQTLRLREKARIKFTQADKMFFTTTALEQASAEVVTAYRSKRFAEVAAGGRVIDLCCSIGSDALPLAGFASVVAVDMDELRLEIAKHNFAVYGRTGEFVLADITSLEPRDFSADAFFIDPARRDENGKRIFDPRRYSPPLSEIMRWQEVIENGCAKLGPGVDKSLLPSCGELEFISVNGQLREACLWFGALRSGGRTSATLLPGGVTLSGAQIDADFGAVRDYIIEPDPAVVRAGLCGLLADEIAAWEVAPSLLSSGSKKQTPFATHYQVHEVSGYDLKLLKKHIKANHIGNLEIKCRTSMIAADELRKKLTLKGKNSQTLFVVEIDKRLKMILTTRCNPS